MRASLALIAPKQLAVLQRTLPFALLQNSKDVAQQCIHKFCLSLLRWVNREAWSSACLPAKLFDYRRSQLVLASRRL